jgi:hypothetical protein
VPSPSWIFHSHSLCLSSPLSHWSRPPSLPVFRTPWPLLYVSPPSRLYARHSPSPLFPWLFPPNHSPGHANRLPALPLFPSHDRFSNPLLLTRAHTPPRLTPYAHLAVPRMQGTEALSSHTDAAVPRSSPPPGSPSSSSPMKGRLSQTRERPRGRVTAPAPISFLHPPPHLRPSALRAGFNPPGTPHLPPPPTPQPNQLPPIVPISQPRVQHHTTPTCHLHVFRCDEVDVSSKLFLHLPR